MQSGIYAHQHHSLEAWTGFFEDVKDQQERLD